MDGWLAIETDVGKAVLKTSPTKATSLVLIRAADASGNHTLYIQGCRQSYSNEASHIFKSAWQYPAPNSNSSLQLPTGAES